MSNQKGAPVSQVARRWAREIDQDFELVASILFRYSRGDFHERVEPLLRQLLSGPDNPLVPVDDTRTETVKIRGENIDVVFDVDPRAQYLIGDIEAVLKENDPHIGYVDLRVFLAKQRVPIPVWLDPNAKPMAAPQPTANQLRKAKTQEMYNEWRKEYRRLQKNKPGKTKTWYAKQIAKMGTVAHGKSFQTIRGQLKNC